MSKKKMEDLDEVVQEIDNLPDDLYLDDVGEDGPEKKFTDWVAVHNRRNMGTRGRGRGNKRAGFERSIDNADDDLFGVDEHDLNALENWDLGDDDLDALQMKGERSKKAAFRNRNARSRGIKRGVFKRGIGQRQFRPERFENVKSTEDVFDIESKSHRQRFVWNREDAYSNDDRLKRSGENVERDEHMSPGFLVHRKDPRIANRQLSESGETRFGPSRNDPRLKQPETSGSETMDNIYAPARKDPRLVPQQALPPRQQRNERMKQFENRFGMRKDPRFGSEKVTTMQNQILDIGPPGVEEIIEPLPSNEQSKIRRGPRSPSPSPPRIPGERSISISPERKHDRSPSSWRSRSHRERSLSPRRRNSRHDSLSPRRQDWRSSSRDHGSPNRRSRRERSFSPRSRHRYSREWSLSPRRDHSHDRSLSDRRDRSLSPRGRRSFSPPRRSSISSSRDESWRQSPGRMPPPPCFSQMQPPQQQSYEVLGPPPPNMYSEGNYSGSAPSAPSYGGPPASTSAPPPPPPPPSGYSNYQQYGYDNYYQQPPPPPAPNSYSGEYAPPTMPPATWSDGGMVYPDISQPPPVQVPGASGNQASGTGALQSTVDQKSEEAKKEAVKNEMIQQKQTLSKQREEYVRKKTLIAHELELLKEQEEELLEEHSRDNERILKENHKLQLEIQNKLKAINNVIDMLTGIIGDKSQQEEKRKASHKDSEKKKPKTPPETPPQSSSDSEHEGKVEDDNLKHASKDKPAYNYVHYDPEMHWCRVCDVFPRTAKEYLNHLHSTEHKEETLERKLVDMPWHKNMADHEVPHIPGAPTKRTPIRGLQFFISATAWYCKMCDIWIGDLHCASLHLKSKRHAENYAKFTEQNPHWETDWLADRERAYERCSEERRRVKDEKDTLTSGIEQASASGKHFLGYPKNIKIEVKPEMKIKKKNKEQHKKMKKNCLTALDELKKKKHHKKKQKSKKSHGSPHSSYSSGSNSDSSSSSNSSDEGGNVENDDKTKSIRVAMRNKIKGLQEHVQQPQVPLLPRSRWDSPPEEKPDEAEKESTEWASKQHESKLKQPTGDDKLIQEWMSTSKEVSDGEKQLLNSIKDRLRQKQEADRERERERRDDRRDSRRGKRQSESPSSPSYRSKRYRSDKSPEERRDRTSRFDRYDRHETIHRSPERSRRDSGFKSDQKSKEEPEAKLADRKSELEKKILAKFDEDEDDDEESAESKFEKQTAESAAKLMKKAKKPAVMAIPKSKLPFIGRMPILKHFAKKKKPDETKSDDAKKQLPEDPLVQAQYKLEFTNIGGKVHIGPQESGTIGPELPPAEQVQDMEIDEDTSNSDAGPPVIETSVTVETETVEPSPSAKKPATDIPLPKDFQDALNILFPGQEIAEKKEELGANPPGVIQSGPKPPSNHQQGHWPPGHPAMGGPPMMPPMQGYGGGPPMMGPMHGLHGPHPQGIYGPPYGMPVPPGTMMGPHPANMMCKSEPPLRHPPPPPPKESTKVATPKKEMPAVRKSDVAGEMSADELAMLGIDIGDMAAQSF